MSPEWCAPHDAGPLSSGCAWVLALVPRIDPPRPSACAAALGPANRLPPSTSSALLSSSDMSALPVTFACFSAGMFSLALSSASASAVDSVIVDSGSSAAPSSSVSKIISTAPEAMKYSSSPASIWVKTVTCAMRGGAPGGVRGRVGGGGRAKWRERRRGAREGGRAPAA